MQKIKAKIALLLIK